MNKQIEALKMAIEFMDLVEQYASNDELRVDNDKLNALMANAQQACKEALAEAEKQEWQSLSDDEIDDLWAESSKDVSGSIRLGYTTKQHYFYVLIEQALKEKNKC